MIDTYETIEREGRASLKVERSEFIAIAFPVREEDEFFAQLAHIQKEFFDASHHCWAFRLRGEKEHRTRSSDAGEPSGTAGKPIANAIDSAELVDCGVIVVRYYGGVKLGTGGLGRAYRDAAREVLGTVTRLRRYVYRRVAVSVPHAALSNAYRLISTPDVVLAEEEFGEINSFSYDVRLSHLERFTSDLTEKRFAFSVTPLMTVR